MAWYQANLTLKPRVRGFHLITSDVLNAIPEIEQIRVGLLHVFIQHTSASLTINEDADPDVRVDMETAINLIVREDFPYIHTLEGPDDMPAHIKASFFGNSVSLPVTNGRPNLGTWQGIYLCEHRNRGGARHLVATINGRRS